MLRATAPDSPSPSRTAPAPHLQQVERVAVLVRAAQLDAEGVRRLLQDAPLVEHVLNLLGLRDGRLVHDLRKHTRMCKRHALQVS